jgi:hypothetical protein
MKHPKVQLWIVFSLCMAPRNRGGQYPCRSCHSQILSVCTPDRVLVRISKQQRYQGKLEDHEHQPKQTGSEDVQKPTQGRNTCPKEADPGYH